MLSFGIMTLNKRNEKSYFLEIAKRANQHGIDCFRFVPSDISPVSEKISGDYYNPNLGEWERSDFSVPEILYDRCFYGEDSHSKQCMSIVNWLKTRDDIQFLGYGLPNKFELYDVLSNSSISPYLIKTEPFANAEEFLKNLYHDQAIILKPARGSQGQGIYYIEKTGGDILVKTDKKGTQVSHSFNKQEKIISWLNRLTAQRKYLVQPYVNLSNESSQPFDIRILLQKDSKAAWREMGRGIRTGKNGGIISNLSAGGTNISFDEWISSYPAALKNYIYEELAEITNTLPAILEEKLPPLFELGIDIGVGKNGAIWILDVNSKPGRQTILNTRPEMTDALYSAPLLYALHLAAGREQERRPENAKTVSH